MKYTITIRQLEMNFGGDENEFLNFLKRFTDYTEFRAVRERDIVGNHRSFVETDVLNVYCK